MPLADSKSYDLLIDLLADLLIADMDSEDIETPETTNADRITAES